MTLFVWQVPTGMAQRDYDDRRYEDRRYDDRRDNDRRYNSRRSSDRRYDDQQYDDYDSDEPRGRHNSGNSYCRQLERELASDWVRGRANTNVLPELNQKIRAADKLYNKLQNRGDRMNCYESMFIFGRSVRRTRKCLAIDKKIRTAKRELARLRKERSAIRDSRNTGNRRNQLLEKLARNNCGEQYRYEARRNSSTNWFGGGLGEIFGEQYQRRKPRRKNSVSTQIQPYATYRTMCVRLCDGFYYPVSFSTLPSNFAKDTESCQSECAAPAELFVYRNPGGEVEQMISPNGRAYDSLENAWRFRKEYIKGCSCKRVEYSEEDIAAHMDAKGKKGVSKPVGKQGAAKSPKKPAIARKSSKQPRSIEDLIR